MEPLLLTARQAAQLLSTTHKTLEVARNTGKGAYASLPFVRVGSSIRYEPQAIRTWLEGLK